MSSMLASQCFLPCGPARRRIRKEVRCQGLVRMRECCTMYGAGRAQAGRPPGQGGSDGPNGAAAGPVRPPGCRRLRHRRRLRCLLQPWRLTAAMAKGAGGTLQLRKVKRAWSKGCCVSARGVLYTINSHCYLRPEHGCMPGLPQLQRRIMAESEMLHELFFPASDGAVI